MTIMIFIELGSDAAGAGAECYLLLLLPLIRSCRLREHDLFTIIFSFLFHYSMYKQFILGLYKYELLSAKHAT